jgi:hypothetical protein
MRSMKKSCQAYDPENLLEQVAHLRYVQRPVEQPILAVQNSFLQRSLANEFRICRSGMAGAVSRSPATIRTALCEIVSDQLRTSTSTSLGLCSETAPAHEPATRARPIQTDWGTVDGSV